MRARFAVLILALTLAAPPAAARDAEGRLDALLVPNDCRPALTTPGGEFQALVRGARGATSVAAVLTGADATWSLELHPVGREEPDGSAWFAGPVAADAPAGAYSLSVQVGGGWDRNRRSVFVVESIPAEYVVAHVTDTHIGRASPPARERMEAVAAQVNQARPLLVLVSGDVTDHGTPEQYREFLQALEAFDAPTFTCAGNHDRGRPTLDSVYFEYCSTSTYHFDVGRDRFVSSDTQFRWADWQRDPEWGLVAEALRGEPATRWRLLVTHRYEPEMSYHLQRYLYGGRIQAVVHGHWHRDFAGQLPGGTQWVATPAALTGYWRLLHIGDAGIEVGELQGIPGAVFAPRR